MLYFSLVLSLVLFGAALFAARPAPMPVRWAPFVVTGIVAGAGPMLLMIGLPPVFLSLVFLGIALKLWPVLRPRVRRFWPMGVSAVVLAFLLTGSMAWDRVARFNRYREQYPIESM